MGKTKDDKEWELPGVMNEDFSITLRDVYMREIKLALSYLKGQEILVTFSKLRKQRSSQQNRFFWGIVVPVVRYWLKQTQGESYTKDEVYYWINAEVIGNKPVITTIMGQEVITMTGKRFSQMSTKEFSDAVEKILQHFAELGCVIPEPNQTNFVTDFLKDE